MGFPHPCWLPHISRPSGSPSKEPEQERRLQEVKAWKSPHGSCKTLQYIFTVRPHVSGLVQWVSTKKTWWFSGSNYRFTTGYYVCVFWTSDKIIEVNGELSHCHVWWHWRGKKLWYTWRIRPGISDCLWLVYKWDKPRNGYVLTRVLHHMHIQFEKATRRSSPAEWVLLSYA